MDSDNEKEVNEPCLKRPRLDIHDCEDDGDSASSIGSAEDNNPDAEDGDVERESVMSGDDFSEFSNLSGLDDQCNEADWLPVAGPIAWVQRQMNLGTDPKDIVQFYLGEDFEMPPDVNQLGLWQIVISLLLETTVQRTKLSDVNTLSDVVDLLKKCQNIVVLTGAGVSVSCGIPDFRSQNGIYARLAKDFPNLPNPQSMFDITFFQSDQRPFFKFAKEIYPGQFEPSPCHKFIRLLETHGKLLRNYTQNIDTLEKVAGVERAIECHGSFATATCMVCKYKVDKEAIRKDIFDQVIPRCTRCGPDVEGAVMKPDIVFFGESLPEEFHKQMSSDKDVCDLLIVIGSSLKVRPVSRIPSSLSANVPQIIINREPLHKQYTFDVELLGNCDDVISELCKRLGEGWELLAKPGAPSEEVSYCDLPPMVVEVSAEAEEDQVQGVREDVVEYNADSGMGDFEAVASAFETEDRKVCSGNNSVSASSACSSSNDSQSARSGEHLERLSSIDSGTESSTTVDTQGPAAVQSLTASSSSKPHSRNVSPSSPLKSSCQHHADSSGSSSREFLSQGNCKCEKKQEDHIPAQHTNHTDSPSHTAESGPSQSVESSQTKSAATHHRHSAKAAERSESLATCGVPIEWKTRPKKGCAASSRNEKEEGGASELNKDGACVVSDDRHEMKRLWERRKQQSIATRCKENQIIFVSPNRYIFPGAEVYSDDSDDSDSDDGSHLSISPIAHNFNEDAKDSQNAVDGCASPLSALCDRASSQDSSSQPEDNAPEDRSPCSTPPSSPFAASDESRPACTSDSPDKSEKERKTFKMRGCSVLNLEAKRSHVRADKSTSHYSALLGPLYPHFNFLESLYTSALHTPDHMAETEALVIKDSSEAVMFLTQRADFWQQESPLYTRERNRRKELKSSRAHLHTGDPMLCMLQELDVIDHGMEYDSD
ncbi:hypothetical protein ACOMHN_033993 [Nucella lapillus]